MCSDLLHTQVGRVGVTMARQQCRWGYLGGDR